MKDDPHNIEDLYCRLLNYRATLQSIVGKKKDTDSILLNEEQKVAIIEGEGLIKEVEKKIKELEDVLGIRKSSVSA